MAIEVYQSLRVISIAFALQTLLSLLLVSMTLVLAFGLGVFRNMVLPSIYSLIKYSILNFAGFLFAAVIILMFKIMCYIDEGNYIYLGSFLFFFNPIVMMFFYLYNYKKL